MRSAMRSLLSCVFVTSQVAWATRIQATRLPSGSSSGARGQERKLNNYSTKEYEGVKYIVKDGEYTEPDNVRGNYEWPVTLPPKLLRDGFQIEPTKTAAPVTKTEYSTFTYLVTSVRPDGNTLVETDIVVSSNIVTSTPGSGVSGGVEPTPSLPQLIQSTKFEPPEENGYVLMQTKTYFTTSTLFTTFIDKEVTKTKTRTIVRSSVLTETYSGGQFDYLPSPDKNTSPTIEENPKEKYISLSSNIYGLVKTLYTTYTYHNGLNGKDSREVITQESTSWFSTTALPASITIAPSPPLPPITATNTASLQLDRDTLLSIKNQYISQQSSATDSVEPSFTATYAPDSSSTPVSSTATPLVPDTLELSSIKDSIVSSLESVQTEVNVPASVTTVIRPTSISSTRSSSTSVLSTSSLSGDSGSQDDSSSSSEDSSSATQEAIAGGLLGAIGGGIASAILQPPPPPGGIQVDLGPVLDAVATLLRGPIRSAIANRRNTAAIADRTDTANLASASVPQFARIPSAEPNVIPVGGYSSGVSRDSQYGFIPLNAPQQALPRSDTDLEADNYNDIGDIPEDILNILGNTHNGGDNPIVVDRDKIVINDHIIRTTDPHIIDVLNKYEHSYLYNKETNDPLKIRIAAGGQQQSPQQSQQQPTKIFGVTLPKINIPGIPQKKPHSQAPRPVPPPPPPQRRPPPRRPHPAKRPYNNRPLPPPSPTSTVIKNQPVSYKPPGSKKPISNGYGNKPAYSVQPINGPPHPKANIPYSKPRPGGGYKPPQSGYKSRPGPVSGYKNPAVNNRAPKPPRGSVSNAKPQSSNQGSPYSNPSYKKPQVTSNAASNVGGSYNNNPPKILNVVNTAGGSYNKPLPPVANNVGGSYNKAQITSNSVSNTEGRGSYNKAPPPVANNNDGGSYNKPKITSTADAAGSSYNKPYSSSAGASYSNSGFVSGNQVNIKSPSPPAYTNTNSGSSSPAPSVSSQTPSYVSQNVNPFNEVISHPNKYSGTRPGPPGSSVIDSSVNTIPGSNQWNTYGPGSLSQDNGFQDNGNLGQGQSRPVHQGTGSHASHGITGSTLNNDESNVGDSLSSVSEQSKIVMAAPAGMIEDDTEGHFATSETDNPKFDPTVSHSQHNSNSFTSNSVNTDNDDEKNGNVGGFVRFPTIPAVPKPPSPSSETSRPSPPRRPTSRPPQIRRTTSRPRPKPTRRVTPSQNRRTTFRPPTAATNPQLGLSRKPNTGRRPFRPNEVAIDTPAFGPNDNVQRPFVLTTSQQSSGDILRNQHNGGRPRTPAYNSNPYRSRQTTSELSASVIQGSNQIIGGGGIVIGTPNKGYMRDVTITGTDGSTAIIQTRFEGLATPDIDPSFTVSAGYSPVSRTKEVFTIQTTQSSLFTEIKPSSNKNYEYEGWLTDGDPLKKLPPLRASAAQPLDIRVIQTEAPKTVTYQNEWQTPSQAPTADFIPVQPPAPASNFEREWSTYKTGQVETVDLIKPTNTLTVKVQETEAPKTVTYANEWFANSASNSVTVNDAENPPAVVPDFVNKNPYPSIAPIRLTPRPSRPKYRPKTTRPRRPPVGTVEEASLSDNDSNGPVPPTRRPFRNRSTRKPYRRPTQSIRRGTPTPEIITGGVRVPPRPPPGPSPRPPQTYDPFAEYEDRFPDFSPNNDDKRHRNNHGNRNRPGGVVLPVIGRPSDGANNYDVLLQNAVKNRIADKVDVVNEVSNPNIKISSDGYNGFKEINAGYPDTAENSDSGNDQLISGGGSGLNEYPGLVTTARPTDTEVSNKIYNSSEYVNERRWQLSRKPGAVGSGDNVNGDIKELVEDDDRVFSPTRRPGTEYDEQDDKSDGRKSSGSGEIDLHNFFDNIKGEDKSQRKRKFETSTRTRNTFSTRGKPTFINVDLSTTAAVPITVTDKDEGDNSDDGSDVIVTSPIQIIDEQTTSQIRPISSSSRPIRPYQTLTGTVTPKQSPIVSSIKIGGFKFPKRPRPDLSYKAEEEIKDDETLNKNVEAAIVEQVPEHILSAEDGEPETRCQKRCGDNMMCHITSGGDTQCKCRPGFGKPTNLPDAKCEKSMMYQIEVITTSEDEETRIVRFNPKVLQQALDESFENKIKDLYHHSEITSIKVNNNTKRNFELKTNDDNKNVDRDSQEDMKIKLLVQVAEGNVAGQAEEERIRNLIEPTLKETNLPLGSDVMVSRVTIDDFDECTSVEYNDCSNKAICTNTKGSYNCTCMPGYLDITPASQLSGRLCSGASTECELCNRNGQCVLDSTEVSCNCNPWFAGKNCQINLKLLLIVGAVSVCLMMIIACGVSCFCCRDRRKKPIPVPYGVSMARLPPNVRQGMMMDPNGTVKSAMSGRSRQPRHVAPPPGHGHPPLGARNSGPWQEGFGSVASRGSRSHVSPGRSHVSHVSPAREAGARSHSRGSKPALVIPRAKVTPSRGYTNTGYHSDTDDRFSQETQKNRAMSEVESQGSRHRRKSVPSFASSLLSGRGRREGSVDPLLEGFQSDGGDSGGRNSNSTFHRSVSRGDFDAMSRAETRSVARSFNETIIRPVTRRLQSAAGTSTRSNRSTRTSEDGRTMAEKDGGSSFVVSPNQRLYRLHDSDGSFESL